jgi:hypothetical protein
LGIPYNQVQLGLKGKNLSAKPLRKPILQVP